jgi:hypothetical protein
LKNSKVSIGILILLALAMYPLGNVVGNFYLPQGPTDITALSIGDTVVAGTTVTDNGKIRKVPLLYHPEYLMYYISNMEFLDITDAVITGTVRTPTDQITSSSISKEGNAQGFNGPGVLAVTDNKLTVIAPGNFVYGYKTPYTFGIKTKDGLQITEGKNVLKVVPYNQISNDTVPHNYVSVNSIKEWYNSADTGDHITLDYAIANFNDGRKLITPENIQSLFGAEVLNYMENYPSGKPILVYGTSVTEKVIGTGADTLGFYAEYNNENREINAREFVKAWNGTVIPPHTTSSGKETVGFEKVTDPHAPGGWASHGVCPAARTLRAAVSQAGFGLPVGLSWGEYAVKFGYNPAVDVTVTNTKDYPVKIVMWTEGSGTGMTIHAKVIELIPNT